ncbi:hypothetical protein LMG7974_00586 [Campylobacter majalis]|uniref:TonB-dependent receptor n=1 Tax=Campylobacter majalis TaxID=2790656 RepID=A0ABN7K5A6_9BACT|nr:hypothetical protein [Campylobacter majalis]CAD7287706.1 hypothetical protein LMG7974_00586 [Campylobacter majalis]
MFAYKLNDGKESLRHTYRLNPYTTYNQNWTYYAGNKNLTKFSQLDIPYDDETSFGLKQHIGPISVNTKYIERKGRKQIVQVYASTLGIDCGDGYAPGTSQCRLYTNDGWSDNKIFSLSISNIEPIKFLNTSHNIELGYSKQKSKTNNSTYTSVNTDDFEDAIVYYDGNLMRRSSLPVANFYTPWTASATLVSHVPQLNLTLSNFVHYKSSKEALRTAKNSDKYKDADGNVYPTYYKTKLKATTTWDMRIAYEQKLAKDISGFINLDINNVLNKINEASATSGTSPIIKYEPGRQFWLEAGVKW